MLGLNERFHLRELIDAGRRIRATDSYDLLAIAGAEQALLDARRRIALGILAEPGAHRARRLERPPRGRTSAASRKRSMPWRRAGRSRRRA